jgi:broad specificity phosphatase PhoE
MIYLVRHGQTVFNLERRYQGACDSPLTALGERQARAMGALLAGLVPADTPIVSSPLGRAASTALILAQAGGFTAPVTLDPRLAEISMGSWDGLLLVELEALRPPFDTANPPPDWYMRSPDGETYEAFAARLADWLRDTLAEARTVIAVSHGVSGRVLRGLYAGLPRDEALRLPVPQDAVFRMADGVLERIECEPVA